MTVLTAYLNICDIIDTPEWTQTHSALTAIKQSALLIYIIKVINGIITESIIMLSVSSGNMMEYVR